jgi:hypothetical protein
VVDQVYARLMEMGFVGISVFLVEAALLIILIGHLIQFVRFSLKHPKASGKDRVADVPREDEQTSQTHQ